jgi:hypothetical protein
MVFGLFGVGGPSVVDGFGPGAPGAVPEGVLVASVVVGPVCAAAVDASGDGAVDPPGDEADGDASLAGATVGVPAADEPLVGAVEGLDIAPSVRGVSCLLQAPSAATAVRAAASAT